MPPATLNRVLVRILIAIVPLAPICEEELLNKANANALHCTSGLLIRPAQSMTLITLCLFKRWLHCNY